MQSLLIPAKTLTIFLCVTRVILPGGHVKLNHSGYTQVGKKLLQLAIKVCSLLFSVMVNR